MPLRARRRRVRALVALGILVVCGALFYAVSWASYLPQYNISSISVSGARSVSDELVVHTIELALDDGAYHIISRRNVFFYPREALQETLVSALPPVRSARITHPSFSSTEIHVALEEREPFARWCSEAEGPCYLMDEGGFIYAPMENVDGTLFSTSSTQYVFTGRIASSTLPIGQSFIKAHLPGLVSLLKFLGQAGFAPRGAHVENDQDLSVRLQEGFILKASFGADAGTLVKNLELVLSSDVLEGKRAALEYIDLRFGNRVYYKLKGQEQQSAE